MTDLLPYLYTYLLGATPVVELRAAIPVGYLHYDLGITWSTILGILGSLTLAVICLLSIPIAEYIAFRIPLCDKILKAVLEKTRAKHSHKMQLWGEVFLVILVAIPLPGSGALTGSLLAYLFGVKRLTALKLIATGVIISGLVVAFLTVSGHGLWGLISQWLQ